MVISHVGWRLGTILWVVCPCEFRCHAFDWTGVGWCVLGQEVWSGAGGGRTGLAQEPLSTMAALVFAQGQGLRGLVREPRPVAGAVEHSKRRGSSRVKIPQSSSLL